MGVEGDMERRMETYSLDLKEDELDIDRRCGGFRG
jgi:hypothetical protein